MSHAIRIFLGVFAIAFIAQGASAQFVCEKLGKNGKAKYKIRSECRVEKGETAVTLPGGGEAPAPVDLPRLFHTSSDGTTNVSGTTFVQLTDEAGVDNTVFQFETTADSTDARVTFSADCALTANGNSGWLDIDVVVNGLDVFPLAGGATRFCQIGDEIAGTSPVMAATEAASYTVVVPDLGPGTHAVSIATSLLGGVTGAIQRPVLAISTFPNQD